MTVFKKTLSVFLAALMLCFTLPLGAVAEVIVDENGNVVEASADYQITASASVVKPGDEIAFVLTVNKAFSMNSYGIDFAGAWDEDVFEPVSGEWLLTGGMIANVNFSGKAAAFAAMTPVKIYGDIFTFTLKVKDDAKLGSFAVTPGLVPDKLSGLSPVSVSANVCVKGTQSALSAPEMESHTYTSVTLKTVPGAEYSMDGKTWQASPVFEGLSPATSYTFYQRLAETETLFAGDVGPAAELETDRFPTYLEIVSLPTKLEYDRGEDLDLTGLELLYHDIYGKANRVDPSEVTVSGYDKTKAAEMSVTLKYLDAEIAFTVKSYAKLVIQGVSAMAGETVDVFISVENAPDFNAIGIEEIAFDSDRLELLAAEWLNSDFLLKNWNLADRNGVATMESGNANLNGNVAKLTFRVADGAENSILSIDCSVKALLAIVAGQTEQEEVLFRVIPGEFEIKNYVPGDVDGTEGVSSSDAIYLLYYTLFGEDRYPVNQNCDYDKDGIVSSSDAIYLLYYTLFGEDRYPIA